jgi:hypothetical protein
MLLAAFLTYGIGAPVFLVWWAMGRGDRQNMSRAPRPILRKPREDAAGRFSNRNDPSRGGTVRAFNNGGRNGV